MRVLLFRTLCDTGGVSTWMLKHARELERRGVACDFWFCRKSRRLAEFEATGQVTVGPVWELVPLIESRRYDVVHVPSGDPLADLVARAAPHGTAVVATSHGALARMFDSRSCTALTCVSNGNAALNQPWTDVAIDVITNGVDLERFEPSGPSEEGEASPIIAFVGRTTAEVKQFPRFTRIAAVLVERGYRVWIADAHAAGWGELTGRGCVPVPTERWRPHSLTEMPAFYRSVGRSGGVVLMTSLHEGFPLVPPEAAACGAPSVGPDVVGVREAIIPDQTGLLFGPADNDVQIAQRIDAWLRARGDLAQWRMRCAEVARAAFGVERMTDQYLDVYGRRTPNRLTRRPRRDESITGSAEEHFLQTWWRSQASVRSRFLAEAALGLVHHDYPDLALWAVRRALVADPRALLSANRARKIGEVTARVTLRPDRLRQRLSSRRQILSTHAVA